MVDRVSINIPTYMALDGQWQIVLSGVVDVPTGSIAPSAAVSFLSPAEMAGTLASHGKPTPVRNVRTR